MPIPVTCPVGCAGEGREVRGNAQVGGLRYQSILSLHLMPLSIVTLRYTTQYRHFTPYYPLVLSPHLMPLRVVTPHSPHLT